MAHSRIVVLGAGRVGSLIARDLAADPDLAVRTVDRDAHQLGSLAERGIETRTADLADTVAIQDAVADADVVVAAVPGAVGHRVLEALVEAGKPTVDISFSPEDPWPLDAPARARGIPVVVDCGVAPGLSNLMAGRSAADLDRVESVRILVGGLPVRRVWPWEYRAVFSPADVIEEYVRPSRIRRDGVEVVVPALSDVELVDFPEIGTLEAFFTDGLRTLLRTLPVPELTEKTLRYPGHAAFARALRESGFLDTAPLHTRDGEVSPRALAEAVLIRAWELPKGEEEFTVMRVIVEGSQRGRPVRETWDLLDHTDRATGSTSMARTSGFPAAIVARLVARGRVREPGLQPPELLARDSELTETILSELARRGVRVDRRSDPRE
jgi:lysine 6-dehydrogenase